MSGLPLTMRVAERSPASGVALVMGFHPLPAEALINVMMAQSAELLLTTLPSPV